MVSWGAKKPKHRRLLRPGERVQIIRFALFPKKCDNNRWHWLEKIIYTWEVSDSRCCSKYEAHYHLYSVYPESQRVVDLITKGARL